MFRAEEMFSKAIRRITYPPTILIEEVGVDFSGEKMLLSRDNDEAYASLNISVEIDGDEWSVRSVHMTAFSCYIGEVIFDEELVGDDLENAKKYLYQNFSNDIEDELVEASS